MNEAKQQASKNEKALFLSTDSLLEDEKILEIYALRWGIETLKKTKAWFFKRTKPPLWCVHRFYSKLDCVFVYIICKRRASGSQVMT